MGLKINSFAVGTNPNKYFRKLEFEGHSLRDISQLVLLQNKRSLYKNFGNLEVFHRNQNLNQWQWRNKDIVQ